VNTAWLIVAASMSLVIGSIFWILPGPADRKKMKLRQLACQQGFKVCAMNSDAVFNKFAIKHSENLLYYSRSGSFAGYPDGCAHLPDLVAIPVAGSWRFYTAEYPQQMLTDIRSDTFPENAEHSVSCLYFSKKEVGMLWNENADIAETERTLALLPKLHLQAKERF
jgi:hypothetical protein